MTIPITSMTATVEAVLSEGLPLSVPYFQRGYAWETEHAERLVSDLVTHAEGGLGLGWYPLGVMILARAAGASTSEVADGHQRLITLTLLLAVMRDLEREAGLRARLSACVTDAGGVPRFSPQAGVARLFAEAVQRDGATLHNLAGDVDSCDLPPVEIALIQNLSVIRRRMQTLDEERRRMVAEFVLARVVLVVVTVESDAAARLLFQTLHDTGVRPEPADLLKSSLIGQVDRARREEAQAVWEGLEIRIGRGRIASLLANIAAIQRRTVPARDAEATLARHFTFQDGADAGRFVLERLRTTGARFAEIVTAGQDLDARPSAVFRRLQYLTWIVRHETWQLPALAWLTARSLDDPETPAFLARLEALAWLQTIRAEDGPRRDRRYLALVEEVEAGRALGAEGALSVAAAERRQARDILVAQNFSRRPYKVFLLLRLNAAAEGDDRVRPAPYATVEHVLPQRPASNSRWLADYAGESEAEVGRVRHLLGNLTLLTEREQNLAANQDFTIKRSIYAESQFEIAREVAGEPHWLADKIRARTDMLADRFLRVLRV